MADTLPAQFKSLQLGPFAKRASQLEPFKPIIAYWLRFHIVQRIIAAGLHSADQECTAYTTELMEKLEQTKAQYPNEDAILDDVAASAYCEQFALQTFAKGERDMAENKVTNNTVDTLLAASTLLEILSIWKTSDAEIASKTKYAKYHALRILKAIKAHQDPNLTNPAREQPEQAISPPALDPGDPEVQSITQSASSHPQPHNPYQPSVETAQPSPVPSVPSLSPPPNLPSAPTGHTQSSHNDVSPISQPDSSRHGSIGGGYFPKTDLPTFTAGMTAPSLPTAPSLDNEPAPSGLGGSSLPTDSRLPQAPQAPDPASFYLGSMSPPPNSHPPLQSPPQDASQMPPHQNTYRLPPGQNPYASPPLHQQQPPVSQPNLTAKSHQHQMPQGSEPVGAPFSHFPRTNPYGQPPVAPPTQSQGPFRDDEMSIAEAQKHAKWAISALNFDDAATAVKELRIALRALGAE